MVWITKKKKLSEFPDIKVWSLFLDTLNQDPYLCVRNKFIGFVGVPHGNIVLKEISHISFIWCNIYFWKFVFLVTVDNIYFLIWIVSRGYSPAKKTLSVGGLNIYLVEGSSTVKQRAFIMQTVHAYVFRFFFFLIVLSYGPRMLFFPHLHNPARAFPSSDTGSQSDSLHSCPACCCIFPRLDDPSLPPIYESRAISCTPVAHVFFSPHPHDPARPFPSFYTRVQLDSLYSCSACYYLPRLHDPSLPPYRNRARFPEPLSRMTLLFFFAPSCTILLSPYIRVQHDSLYSCLACWFFSHACATLHDPAEPFPPVKFMEQNACVNQCKNA